MSELVAASSAAKAARSGGETLKHMLWASGFEPKMFGSYAHVVSLGYLFSKVAAVFGRAESAKKHSGPIFQIPVPVNLGDFMLVVAERIPPFPA